MPEKPDEPTILIVDDDDVDGRAVRRSLAGHGITNPVRVVTGAAEALETLRGAVTDLPQLTYIVLLDLNMPGMDGHDFLAELRSDDQLSRTVVFVLTTSTDQVDIDQAYDRNVAGYVVKGDAGKDFVNLVAMLDRFSITVRFPSTVHDAKAA